LKCLIFGVLSVCLPLCGQIVVDCKIMTAVNANKMINVDCRGYKTESSAFGLDVWIGVISWPFLQYCDKKNLVKHPMNSGECRNQICFLELVVLL